MRRLMLALVVVLAACGGPTPDGLPTGTPTPASTAGGSPVGFGTVTFGMAFDEETSTIRAPTTGVPRGYAGTVWFIASFGEAPESPSVTLELYRRSTSGMLMSLVSSTVAQVADPRAPTWSGGRTLAELGALEPGAYVLRFARGATLLAEGTFTVR